MLVASCNEYCKNVKAKLPLDVRKRSEIQKVSDWVRKRPAAASRAAARSTPKRKRTAFSRRRDDELVKCGPKRGARK